MLLSGLTSSIAKVREAARRIYDRPTGDEAAPTVTSSGWPAYHTKAVSEADVRGAVARWLGAIATATITAHWLGWSAMALWVVVLVFFEGVVVPATARGVIVPNVRRRPRLVKTTLALLAIVGACLYVVPWALSWRLAGEEVGFFAGLALGLTLMHGAIYQNRSALAFWVCVGPAVIAAVFVGMAAQVLQAPLWIIALALAQAVFYSVQGQKDSRTLKQLVRDQREQVASAQQAAQAKSDFLATMSHELRTPLSAVIGYAEILEEELIDVDQPALANDASRIRRAARSLLVLINEMLDFSKIDAGRMELSPVETNVPDVMTDVLETVRHVAQTNGNVLSLDIAPEVPTLILDGHRLRQCILNLVGNACKFTENGRIHIAVSCTPAPEGSLLSIAVSDTGCGISAEDRERLFKPFVQVDGSQTRKQGGTGLGLVITQRLANMMGGDVTLESEVGKGSTFTLTVLGVRPEVAQDSKPHGVPSVVVVEDESGIVDIYRRILSRLPIRASFARTAAEGAALIASEAPSVVVLDVHLPDRSGLDLLQSIKSNPRTSAIDVIVCSVDDNARATAFAMGAGAWLIKPFDREGLSSTIMQFLTSTGSAPEPGAVPAARLRA